MAHISAVRSLRIEQVAKPFLGNGEPGGEVSEKVEHLLELGKRQPDGSVVVEVKEVVGSERIDLLCRFGGLLVWAAILFPVP